MDNIIFEITNGALPIQVELDSDPVRAMSITSYGQYSFVDVPQGVYSISLRDRLGCELILPASVGGNTPPVITYSATFINHECEEQEEPGYLTGLVSGVNYENCPITAFPKYEPFFTLEHIAQYASNIPIENIDYFEVLAFDIEEPVIEFHKNNIELQVGDKLYPDDEYIMVYITSAVSDSKTGRIQLRYKKKNSEIFSNEAWFRWEIDGCPEWTTEEDTIIFDCALEGSLQCIETSSESSSEESTDETSSSEDLVCYHARYKPVNVYKYSGYNFFGNGGSIDLTNITLDNLKTAIALYCQDNKTYSEQSYGLTFYLSSEKTMQVGDPVYKYVTAGNCELYSSNTTVILYSSVNPCSLVNRTAIRIEGGYIVGIKLIST